MLYTYPEIMHFLPGSTVGVRIGIGDNDGNGVGKGGNVGAGGSVGVVTGNGAGVPVGVAIGVTETFKFGSLTCIVVFLSV
jgi:hypothetical protein